MEASVRGIGIAINDELRDYIDQRLQKLDRWVNRVVESKVELRPGVRKAGRSTVIAQITVQTSRNVLRAEAEDADAKLAFDGAADRLATQLRRYHERRTARKADRGLAAEDPTTDAVLAEIVATLPPVEDDADEPGAGRVVRVKRFGMKPMDIDEAIDQMELLGHDFYLFDNADEGAMSVVYRRRAGDYGVLVPDRK